LGGTFRGNAFANHRPATFRLDNFLHLRGFGLVNTTIVILVAEAILKAVI
jgi:hypothetical protein